MRPWLLLLPAAILASAAVAAPLEAQKNCRKGIPCGNTCISATKTCRIGSSSAPTPRATPPRETTPRDPEPTAGAPALSLVGTSEQTPWVAHRDGAEYYRSTCEAANQIEVGERVYFASEEQAQRARYRRSPLKGC